LELVAEVGRKPVLGRPILYGTTDTFLRCFGINTLEDLPELPTTEEAVAGLDNEQLELFQEVQHLQEAQEMETNEETE
jgi:segregation and condensation protein B